MAIEQWYEEIDAGIEPGPFRGDFSSIGDQFRCPRWFAAAKLGFWSHWGPQSNGRSGDWFAKFMYLPDPYDWTHHGAYRNHLRDFGHPTEHGYKDVADAWKAERFDAEGLMDLYQRAGARFFMAMGSHHDNIDCWSSKHHPWNTVNIGPKKDIVAMWKAAADRRGMPFGISFHADYSPWWYQPAFMSDPDGELAGSPYDAAGNIGGTGSRWEGMDLKRLYGIDLSSAYLPDKDPRNDFWHAVPEVLSDPDHIGFFRWYCRNWFDRAKDFVDTFEPDLVYLDGSTYPFSGRGTGRGIRSNAVPLLQAHVHNKSVAKYGSNRAMFFTKGWIEDRRARIEEYEGRFPDDIQAEPCLVDNTIGDWFYLPDQFYSTRALVWELLEVVSRNGTLLMNIMQAPDGTLEPEGLQVLEEMGGWIERNGEAIYDTRPWKIMGEGTTRLPNGGLSAKHAETPFTRDDWRFTANPAGDTVYAFCMAPGDARNLRVRALGTGTGLSRLPLPGPGDPKKAEGRPLPPDAPGLDRPVRNVSVVGTDRRIVWKQETGHLSVELPDGVPMQAGRLPIALKIEV